MLQFFAFVLLSVILGANFSNGAEYDTAKWKDELDRIAASDKAHPPEPGGITFVGSSSIRMWDLEKSFPGKGYVNHGFGGSEIVDSTYYFEELVAKHKPRLVVFYAGDNDVANGKSPEEVLNGFQAFAEKFKKDLPKANLLYISIKPSIARWKLADKMREANRLIEDYGNRRPNFRFVNVWPVMLDDKGEPRKDIFLEDGLHMNEAGYAEWVKLVEPLLK
jgi:lysophospholipase L1-like esterase